MIRSFLASVRGSEKFLACSCRIGRPVQSSGPEFLQIAMYPAHPAAEVRVDLAALRWQQLPWRQLRIVNWPVAMGKNKERVKSREFTVRRVLVEERRNLILFCGGPNSSRVSGSLGRFDLCLLG